MNHIFNSKSGDISDSQRLDLNAELTSIKTQLGIFLVTRETVNPSTTFDQAKIHHTQTDTIRNANARLSISETPKFGLYLFSQLEREKDDVTELEFLVKITLKIFKPSLKILVFSIARLCKGCLSKNPRFDSGFRK